MEKSLLIILTSGDNYLVMWRQKYATIVQLGQLKILHKAGAGAIQMIFVPIRLITRMTADKLSIYIMLWYFLCICNCSDFSSVPKYVDAVFGFYFTKDICQEKSLQHNQPIAAFCDRQMITNFEGLWLFITEANVLVQNYLDLISQSINAIFIQGQTLSVKYHYNSIFRWKFVPFFLSLVQT